MRRLLLPSCLLWLSCTAARPTGAAPDAGVEPPVADDGGISRLEPGAGATDAGVLLGLSATIFHWNTAWNADAAQPLARPMIDRTLAQHVGVFLLEHEWPQAEADTEAAYDAQYAKVSAELLGAGGVVLLQVAGPPRWASSSTSTAPIIPGQNDRPVWTVSPPDPGGDFLAWRTAAARLAAWWLAHAPDAVAQGRVWLFYGAELDNEEFYGPLTAYAPAWEAFSRGVRSVAPHFRVGGGGRLDAFVGKSAPAAFASTEPVLTTWVHGCMALGCRVDFIAGHRFSLNPVPWDDGVTGPHDDFASLRATIDALVEAEGGLAPPLVLTDWTTWEFRDSTRHPWLSSEHDTAYRAAHLTASLAAMQRAGFGAQTAGALFETVSSISDDWSGDWGLFSRRGITKASFNAAALASALDGAVTMLDGADPFLSGLTSTSGGQTQVLVTRFVPDTQHGGRMIVGSLALRLLEAGFTEPSLAAAGCSVTQLQQLAASLDRSACAGATGPLARLLDAWFARVAEVRAAPTTRAVRVRVPWSAPTVTAHVRRVDETRANAGPRCLAAPADCADVDAVNEGFATTHEAPLDAVLADGFVELDLQLDRRAVALVTLSP